MRYRLIVTRADGSYYVLEGQRTELQNYVPTSDETSVILVRDRRGDEHDMRSSSEVR